MGIKERFFRRLATESQEFRGLAQQYRELEEKITEYDRVYYLTSEQERKRRELRKLQLAVKDQMSRIMRDYTEEHGSTIVPASAS